MYRTSGTGANVAQNLGGSKAAHFPQWPAWYNDTTILRQLRLGIGFRFRRCAGEYRLHRSYLSCRSALLKKSATLDDLYQTESKAELRNGELVLKPPTGDDPGFAGDEVFVSLRSHAKQTGQGRAVGDNKGFVVNLPNRRSFSPGAAYFIGERTGMRYLQGAPRFAVEVRSENDCGPQAERDRAEKRRDYFTAGTLPVDDLFL